MFQSKKLLAALGLMIFLQGIHAAEKKEDNDSNHTIPQIDLAAFGKPPFTDTLDPALLNEARIGSGYREGKPYTYKAYQVYYVLSCYDFIHDYAWGPDFRWGKADIRTWKGKFEETYFPLADKSGGALISHTVYQNLVTGQAFSSGRERLAFASIGSGCEPIKDGSKNLGDKTISPNAVPGDFNGKTATGKTLKDDKSADIMDGLQPFVQGGPADRPYNGISGTVVEKLPLGIPDAKKLQLKLAAHLYGMSQLSPKYCKPVGAEFPKSALEWHAEIKMYMQAEKLRDKILKERTDIMQSYSNSANFGGGEAAAQMKAMDLQLDSLNLTIDSLSGSSLFSKDVKASEARASSRIAWRESLLTQALKSLATAADEDLLLVGAYQKCLSAIGTSKGVSEKACERKKIEKKCDEKNNCSDVEVADPVPGSCDMAKSYLPVLTAGPMTDLANIYSFKKIPSQTLNERFVRVNDSMNSLISSYPVSNVKEYDWTSPLMACKEEQLGKLLKSNGVSCTANALKNEKQDYDDTGLSLEKVANNYGLKVDEKLQDVDLKILSSKKLDEDMKTYFSEFGLNEKDQKEAIAYFNDVWSRDDLSLGQSNNRVNYFDELALVLEESIQEDRIKLAEVLAQRQKILEYRALIQKMFIAGSSSSSAAASAASGNSNAGGSAGNVISAVADTVAQQKTTGTAVAASNISAKTSGLKAVEATNYNKAQNVTSAIATGSGLSKNSNSRLSFSDPSTYSNRMNNLGGASGSFSAGKDSGASYATFYNSEIKNLKASINKKMTLKRATISNNTQLASAIAATDARAAKNAKTNKKMSGTSVKYASLSPGLSNVSSAMESFTKKVSIATSKTSLGSSSVSNNASSAKPSALQPKSASSASSRQSGLKSGENSFSPTAQEESEIEKDRSRVQNAIMAVKNDKRDSYTPTEDDSIFEIITKAHIRNYEKVIEEKKND